MNTRAGVRGVFKLTDYGLLPAPDGPTGSRRADRGDPDDASDEGQQPARRVGNSGGHPISAEEAGRQDDAHQHQRPPRCGRHAPASGLSLRFGHFELGCRHVQEETDAKTVGKDSNDGLNIRKQTGRWRHFSVHFRYSRLALGPYSVAATAI